MANIVSRPAIRAEKQDKLLDLIFKFLHFPASRQKMVLVFQNAVSRVSLRYCHPRWANILDLGWFQHARGFVRCLSLTYKDLAPAVVSSLTSFSLRAIAFFPALQHLDLASQSHGIAPSLHHESVESPSSAKARLITYLGLLETLLGLLIA